MRHSHGQAFSLALPRLWAHVALPTNSDTREVQVAFLTIRHGRATVYATAGPRQSTVGFRPLPRRGSCGGNTGAVVPSVERFRPAAHRDPNGPTGARTDLNQGCRGRSLCGPKRVLASRRLIVAGSRGDGCQPTAPTQSVGIRRQGWRDVDARAKPWDVVGCQNSVRASRNL